MKHKILLTLLFFFLLSLTRAQDASFWPDEVKYIPGLEREIFNVDKAHSKMGFSIGFFGFSDVEGTFSRFGGTVLYNEDDLRKTSISLVIDASSINTGSSFRDKDLNRENFFDTEKHKLIRFNSKKIIKKGRSWLAVGDLTMKGITKEVTVPFERTQTRFIDPFWSNLIIGFKGELTLNRMDFDIHGGRWGEKVLSEEVKIEFTIIGQQPNTYKWGRDELSTQMTEVVELIRTEGMTAAKDKFMALVSGKESDGFTITLPAKRLQQKNNFKEVIDFCLFALEQFPDQKPRITRDLAKAYLYLGNKEKALELYGLLGEKNPMDTEALEVLKLLK